MQTSKWGPDGWIFLHVVAHEFQPKLRTSYIKFYKLQGEVLPCKYCRISYLQFSTEFPITPYLNNSANTAYWMYVIHNKVNNKLRNQGLLSKPDPTFKSIFNKYERIRKSKKWVDSMWVFLHTIAHNYDPKIHDPQTYIDYFKILSYIIPDSRLRKQYQIAFKKIPIKNYLSCCMDISFWLYRVNKMINDHYNLPISSFKRLYSKYEQFRADCKRKRGKPDTCRMPDAKNRCQKITNCGRQCSRKKKIDGYCTQHC